MFRILRRSCGMKLRCSLYSLAAAAALFIASTAVAAPQVVARQAAKKVADRCGASDIVVFQGGSAIDLAVGDSFCVFGEAGDTLCDVAQATTTYTCPNGTTVTCSM